MYDALIVGAGPAGAGAAAMLSERGARVLLIEKERFPRYKACGGGVDGLAAAALAEMGLDLKPVQEDAPTELRVTNLGRHAAIYKFDRPLAIMTMRAQLDDLIARSAVARGAEFHEEERIRGARDNGRTVTLVTDKGSYEGHALIGAEGVHSVVARTFGLNPNPVLYVLTSAEMEVPDRIQEAWTGRSQIDISVWPLGYGWIFPKRDHLSIGIGLPRRSARRLRAHFEEFKRRTALEQSRVLLQRSHMLAFRWRRAPLALDRVLVVGDAAGLADPNTGGGIGWALRSARLASETVLAYLRGEANGLRNYTNLIDEEMEPQFRAARILRNTIVLRFVLSSRRATANKGVWSDVVRVIRNERNYKDWYRSSALAKPLSFTARIRL